MWSMNGSFPIFALSDVLTEVDGPRKFCYDVTIDNRCVQ